jgi:hypothetical protein
LIEWDRHKQNQNKKSRLKRTSGTSKTRQGVDKQTSDPTFRKGPQTNQQINPTFLTESGYLVNWNPIGLGPDARFYLFFIEIIGFKISKSF